MKKKKTAGILGSVDEYINVVVVVVAKLIKKVSGERWEPFRRHDFTTRLVFFFLLLFEKKNKSNEWRDRATGREREIGPLCRFASAEKEKEKEKRVVRIPPDSPEINPHRRTQLSRKKWFGLLSEPPISFFFLHNGLEEFLKIPNVWKTSSLLPRCPLYNKEQTTDDHKFRFNLNAKLAVTVTEFTMCTKRFNVNQTLSTFIVYMDVNRAD